jgi:leucyl-tRNA synthetase
MILAPDGNKMSKSKGNTIEPDGLIEQGYGADAIRLMELFIGPWNQAANWSVEGMGGTFRFLQRVWTLSQEYMEQGEKGGEAVDDTELKRVMHRAVFRVTKDLEGMGFNTAIAALMETVNELYKIKVSVSYAQAPETWRWTVETMLQLLAPFAPHMTEELWQQLGHRDSIHTSTWPKYDEQYLASDTMTIVVQVNGKVRAELEVSTDASEDQIVEAAKAHEKVAPHLEGKEVKRTVYVPKKLVSFVV